MTDSKFRVHRRRFVRASRTVLDTCGHSYCLAQAAFPAYVHTNPLVSFLFWSRVRQATQFVAKHAPYQRSLDFGCGGGVLLPILANYSQEVVAHDTDFSGLRAMEKLMPLSSNVTTTESTTDLRHNFPKSFDLIVALDVLEHVDNPKKTVHCLSQLLQPGGRLLVSGPTENFAYRIGRKIAGREFSGDYHVHSIYRVRTEMAHFFHTQTVATLFYPVPLFKLYGGILRDRS